MKKSTFHISYHSRRLSVRPDVDDSDQKILELQQTILDLSTLDEAIQLSVCDCKAQRIMEDNTRVVEGRYEMPVPFKDTIDTLPNDLSWPPNASLVGVSESQNPEHVQAVAQHMSMLKLQGYVVPTHPHF